MVKVCFSCFREFPHEQAITSDCIGESERFCSSAISHGALTFSLMALHFGLGNVIFIFKAMIVLKESLDINEQRQPM